MTAHLLPVLLMLTPAARANTSTYASCAGDGYSIDVGLRPGDSGTDLVELNVDDSRNPPAAYEALITSGRIKAILAAGLVVNNKAGEGDAGILRVKHGADSWKHQGKTHALTCLVN